MLHRPARPASESLSQDLRSTTRSPLMQSSAGRMSVRFRSGGEAAMNNTLLFCVVVCVPAFILLQLIFCPALHCEPQDEPGADGIDSVAAIEELKGEIEEIDE